MLLSFSWFIVLIALVFAYSNYLAQYNKHKPCTYFSYFKFWRTVLLGVVISLIPQQDQLSAFLYHQNIFVFILYYVGEIFLINKCLSVFLWQKLENKYPRVLNPQGCSIFSELNKLERCIDIELNTCKMGIHKHIDIMKTTF